MTPEIFISQAASKMAASLWGEGVPQLSAEVTKKDFEGDYTIVVFPLLRHSHSRPEETAEALGAALKAEYPEIGSYNVIKGFLNISLSDRYWMEVFQEIDSAEKWGSLPKTGKTVMVEFSSPNTNKPLHLGHIRNNLLGSAVSSLLAACGHNVIKVNLVNDRGIHICKSMVAWKKCAEGATPESTGIKGDHLVGDYYVKFNELYTSEVKEMVDSGIDEETAKKTAPILVEAQKMLVGWEQGDASVRALWEMMNGWVYDGFAKTYEDLGISFDRTYYESQTYLLGKALVDKGLEMGVFYRRDDGSVWCDLTADGLDEKLLLRGDGTSVYMTQDLGTAERRFDEYKLDSHIYVVGNEQNYHFQVLKLILDKLGFTWADAIYHLSYGMVELPEGKMKSREGTVVDADDLIAGMYENARETAIESGKTADLSPEDQDRLFHTIALGALKYFILKVDPKKTMLFNPKESIDFNGDTGPFIQYTHARIMSILRKATEKGIETSQECWKDASLNPKEIEIIKLLSDFPATIKAAGDALSPSILAKYTFELAKQFNQYYHDTPILKEENAAILTFRLRLISDIAAVLRSGAGILGITLPDRM